MCCSIVGWVTPSQFLSAGLLRLSQARLTQQLLSVSGRVHSYTYQLIYCDQTLKELLMHDIIDTAVAAGSVKTLAAAVTAADRKSVV